MASTLTSPFRIRPATRDDCETVANLIKELAIYEKMEKEAKLTGKDLERDAFDSTPPTIHILIAELSPHESTSTSAEVSRPEVAGYALYFYNYSMWKGKSIHMEDLYVKPEYRFQGVGEKILKYLAKIADNGNYSRISFECLNWNESAIKFYTKHGAEDVTLSEHWHSYRFENEVMKNLALN